jgi:hypothetical protein
MLERKPRQPTRITRFQLAFPCKPPESPEELGFAEGSQAPQLSHAQLAPFAKDFPNPSGVQAEKLFANHSKHTFDKTHTIQNLNTTVLELA